MNTPSRPPEDVNQSSAPGLAADGRTVDEFRRWVCQQGAPHHLAKYNRGTYEVAVDVLDDPALADVPGASPDRRDLYQAAGQQLGFMMTALDRELSDAETGRLIRLVLHAEQGALYSVEVTPRNYVLGIVFGLAAAARGESPTSLPRCALVREADMFVSGLASVLRDRLGLPNENPGGWLSRLREVEGGRTDTAPLPRPSRATVPSTWGSMGAHADRLARELDPTEVVYLARCRDARVLAEADLFEDDRVAAARPPGEPPQRTRSYYRRLAEECAVYARQLGQVARQAVRGRMLRVVLDVEQGAVYYYRLGPADYLMGVTLNQSRVSEADETIGDLAAELLREGIRTQR
ncbi:hypothetical protein GCM10022254_15670 [Actinomadura meridiana]|uniref:Uncharacterized protein n=1 Tax=Actinomadura meridiana TaxID=559626 RepID=A0ABP8BVH0_9ACTN